MRWFDRLRIRCEPYAIPQLALILAVGQAVFWVAEFAQLIAPERVALQWNAVRAGEYWRPFTFLLSPPALNPILLFFALYLFILMGLALEANWGRFRFNLFFLVGYLGTLAVAVAFPETYFGFTYLDTSVFLAFAFLYPNFELSLFFLIPVKIKYLAAITWIFYGWQLLFGSWAERVIVLAATSNLLLFFGRDVVLRMRSSRRKMAWQAKLVSLTKQSFHRCVICGLTEREDPKMQFRYCSQCAGDCEYCEAHLKNHAHRTDEAAAHSTETNAPRP